MPVVKAKALFEIVQLGKVGVTVTLNENVDPTPLKLVGVTTYVVVPGTELAVPEITADEESNIKPLVRAGEIEKLEAGDEHPCTELGVTTLPRMTDMEDE
jgi:hypothetical protein